jgi:hypothetical protein
MSDSDSALSEDMDKPSTSKRPKLKTKTFNSKWLDEPKFKNWLKSTSNKLKCMCKVCNKEIVAGKSELLKHAEGKKHIKNMSATQKTSSVTSYFKDNTKHENQVKEAEIKLSLFFAEHNVATHVVDHLIPLVKSAFPDSKISQSMQLGRTKCTEIIKNVIGQQEINELVTYLRVNQFSVLVDESTDIGDIKSMCVLVRFVRNCRVQTQLLELIALNPKECNAEGLYKQFKACLVEKHNIAIHNVIGVASDGASVMIGKHNSFFANLKKEVPDVLLLRCICHSAALIANKACEELPKSQEELLRNVANYTGWSRYNLPKKFWVIRRI